MARTRWKPCSTPGCPTLVETAGRCPDCAAKAEAKRGNATERGYDRDHRALKARLIRRLARDIAAGKPAWPCPRCDQPMYPTQNLQLGHTVDRALDPTSRADRLEHAGGNLAAGGRLGAMITNAR